MNVKTIAVIGAGSTGRSIACAAALAGYRTVLEDAWPANLDDGISWIKQRLGEEVSQRRIDPKTRDLALSSLATANTPEDASREADLIIETLPDEMEMKIELFTIFDKFAKPGAILATTTFSLSVTEIAEVTFCPERCIGMHFLNQAAKSPVLELVRGRDTSEETVTTCREVGQRLGREIVVVFENAQFAPNDDFPETKQRRAVGAEE